VTIHVDDEVWAEVFAAASRYERERVSLGEEFVEAVDAALETIAANPEAWAVWPDIRQDDPPVRRYVMPRFPYLIGFQVFADHVMVIVIAYAARRPGYWR
jgi:toxin ParE1/3/4